MLSENDKQQVNELVEIAHPDLRFLNMNFIYDEFEELMKKEIFTEYVEFLKENPDVDGLESEELIEYESSFVDIILAGLDISAEFDEVTDIIDGLRYWFIHRDQPQVNLS